MGWPHRNRAPSAKIESVRPGGRLSTPVEMAAASVSKLQQHIIEKFSGQIYISNQLDVQTGRLWDCIDYSAGGTFWTPNGEFFSNVEAGSGKTLAETNLRSNRRLDAPEAFAVDRIVFTFSKAASPEDVQICMDEIVFRFCLGYKYYVSSPIGHMQTVKEPGNPIKICEYCQAVFVESLQCPGCGARSFKLSTFGSAEAGQQFFMDVYPTIVIANQMSFYVSMESRNPITFKSRLRIWCHLEGLHARGVQ